MFQMMNCELSASNINALKCNSRKLVANQEATKHEGGLKRARANSSSR